MAGTGRTTRVRLAARIAGFPGKISVRCLNHALTAAECARLEALRQRARPARARARGLLDLMAAGDDGWLGAKPEHLGEPTDAELVAEVYQRLGLLDDVDHGGQSPSRYRPGPLCRALGPPAQARLCARARGRAPRPESAIGWGGASPQPA